MAVAALTAEVAELIYREAYFLDRRRWRDWLDLYAPDAVYWAPAFVSDDAMTEDPDNEISLMYMDKHGLEARVFRIEGRDSHATEPLPWTAHLVTNLLVHGLDGDTIRASACWLVHSFSRPRGTVTRGGLYEYDIRRAGDALRIVRKKTMVHDDDIVGPLDIYNI